ncbi:hypothetical protein [Mycobacterium stomatepiae]|uniref:hypothetical protein n=1 Tax=Mycobacterium stomatepiae TaxID=470076 RepID=UPI0013D68D35|nr:hypothetical protein [Mycobacterium stomatepiae]
MSDIPGLDLREGRHSRTADRRHGLHLRYRDSDGGGLLRTIGIGHCELGARCGRLDRARLRSLSQGRDGSVEGRMGSTAAPDVA